MYAAAREPGTPPAAPPLGIVGLIRLSRLTRAEFSPRNDCGVRLFRTGGAAVGAGDECDCFDDSGSSSSSREAAHNKKYL